MLEIGINYKEYLTKLKKEELVKIITIYNKLCDIFECEKNGISCLVAKPRSGGLKKEESFSRKEFKYDKDAHHMIAAKVAEGSMQLLKNDGAVLPIKKG